MTLGWRSVTYRIYTDEGIYEDGEAAMAYGRGAPAAFGMICDLAPLIAIRVCAQCTPCRRGWL